MKILIADKLAPEGAAWLNEQPGTEVVTQTGLTGDELAAALADADGAVIRSAVKLTPEIFKKIFEQPDCRFKAVARAGVGVDNIDLDAATRYGVAVMNSASASTITTAEHAFALMIALCRNIAPAAAGMAAGRWDRSNYVGAQLAGRTLGVVGMGRIGQTVARRALAFDMNVIGYDPFINAESVLDGEVPMVSSFEDLIKQIDIVSFHVPKTDSTTGMLGREQFAMAKPGLLVVNAARGGIVDETALIEACDAGQCAGAAIDVFDTEPPAEDHPFRRHPKILTTPHLGASTVEAQEAVAVDACKALHAYLRGEGWSGAVNSGGLRVDLNDRQRAFANLASRMIKLLGTIHRDARFDTVKFTMRGASIAGRSETIARLGLAELLSSHLDQPVNFVNAALLAEQRGINVESTVAKDTGEDRIAIELTESDRTFNVEGAIYEDSQPRITQLDGYAMDMVPAGHMVVLTNADEPGRIGVVGQVFGDAGINIAEMVIGRRLDTKGGKNVALMVIKTDEPPTRELLNKLSAASGILKISSVALPES